MTKKILTKNIAHSKYKKKLSLHLKRGHITQENYQYLLFQRSLFEEVGESLDVWKNVCLEVMEKYGEMNLENLNKMIKEWAE